jgi:hypothetical protein
MTGATSTTGGEESLAAEEGVVQDVALIRTAVKTQAHAQLTLEKCGRLLFMRLISEQPGARWSSEFSFRVFALRMVRAALTTN